MKRLFSFCLLVFCSWQLALPTLASALAVPAKPTVPIVDQAHILSPEQITSLTTKIEAEATKSSNQIGVLIVPSLQGEALEDYSLKVARAWGIGTKDKNNGVLLLVAIKDRQVRIEVGYGLEGALTDLQSNRIIVNDIRPSFRQGNYYQGLSNGIDGIISSIHNEYVGSAPISQTKSARPKFNITQLLLLPIMLIVWLGSILGRSKSWWAGGMIGGVVGLGAAFFIGSIVLAVGLVSLLIGAGLLLDWLVSRNYQKHAANRRTASWWAGGGFFGGGGFGSGGGGGGFGGGSFGGGGSSGSW